MENLKILSFYWNSTKNISLILKLAFMKLLIFLKINKIFKKTFFLIIQNFINGKSYIFKTSFGTFKSDKFDEWAVLNPFFEPHIKKVILNNYKKNLNKKNIFINIGSHIGRYSIELAKKYNYNSYAFEANPKTYLKLSRNIKLSKLKDKVFSFNFAIGSKNEKLKFFHCSSHTGGSHFIKYYPKSKDNLVGNIIEIPVKPFDEIAKEINLHYKKVKLIIMDVEAFEYDVILGMQKFLKQLKDVDIIIESGNEKKRKKLIKIMKKLGYKLIWFKSIDLYFKK